MRLTKLCCYFLLIFFSFCTSCNKTENPKQELNENRLEVKSNELRGLSAEVDSLLFNNTYTASQKVNYRIDLTMAINKHVRSNPYKCVVLLIKLTQNSGAADSESLLPSLNDIFLKYPVETVTAILDSPTFLLKQFNNKEYIDWLYSAIIQFAFYYLENEKPENRTLLIQKDKNRLKKIINESRLSRTVKNKVVDSINAMQ